MVNRTPEEAREAATRALELNKDEYEDLADRRTFVLPVGILEEHGPHLPLGTDTVQVEAVVHEAAARTGTVVLPTVNYGNCHSTRPFPGSISLEPGTVRQVATEVLEELDRHGVESVVVVSGHAGGGHMRALKQAGRAVIEDADLRVALLSEWDVLFGYAGEQVGPVTLPEGDGHAGTMETARIQHLRPDLVGDPPGEHPLEDEGFELSDTPEAAMPDGYAGDPSQATPELGEVLHDLAVDALVDLFEDLEPSG